MNIQINNKRLTSKILNLIYNKHRKTLDTLKIYAHNNTDTDTVHNPLAGEALFLSQKI